MVFKEDFLHFVWKFRLYDHKSLQTSAGEPIEVVSPGIHNSHSGPDFENAKIKIGETLWAGTVEIHLNSSDWNLHNHSQDKAYDNVVLHVVYTNDRAILRSDGTEIPVLEIKNHLFPDIISRYQGLTQNLSWISCEQHLFQLDDLYVGNWLYRVLVERLEEKSEQVFHLLSECKGSWDDTFYILLARNFGFKINAFPFELLAKSLPQSILAKHKNCPMQIEALVFGQAGMLNTAEDAYSLSLRSEYEFLRQKYQLKPLDTFLWKFLRLRPQNFPTIRLAQFAALIVKSHHLFSRLLQTEDVKQIAGLFENLPVNHYWDAHYRFGVEGKSASSRLGKESVNNIILNSVALTLFSYGRYLSNNTYIERAVKLLENVPFETNGITKRFVELGVRKGNADRSQALLQLKKTYCDRKKCLTCAIGAKIVNGR